jgi:cell wall-associated NlpC family hydrolase
MQRTNLTAIALLLFLASCTSLQPLVLTNSRQAAAPADATASKEPKFLDINTDDNGGLKTSQDTHDVAATVPNTSTVAVVENPNKSVVNDKSSALQVKYAQLMNTDAAQVQNMALYSNIDDWYGTRYHLGGTSKDGIDCSAFVQTIYQSAFGVSLPRTASDQYKATRRISRTDLQEGDLLFFNTRGGVSHVGIYLQNNKFVHASVSGVMISDMFESYYVRHFIAAGRVSRPNNFTSSVNP